MRFRLIDNADPNPTDMQADALVIPIIGNKKMILETVTYEVNPLTFKPLLPMLAVVESPASSTTQSGVWKIKGYASEYDPARNIENIKSITLILDDDEIHYTFPPVTYGTSHSAFAAAHPEYKNPNAGFEIELNTATLPTGTHQFKLRFNRVNGASVTIQALTAINIAAPPVNQPQLPFKWNVDSPTPSQNVADILVVSGWCLEPMPNGQAPAAGANGNIVFVEALLVGGPLNTSIGSTNTWLYRGDVAAAFPEYHNGNSGWSMNCDLNLLPDVQTTAFNLVVRFHRSVGGYIEMGRPILMTTQTSGVVEDVPPTPQPQPPAAPVPTGNYRTRVGNVNIKSGPDYGAPNLRTVGAGYVYQAVQMINSVWMRVRCPDGLEGYTDIPSSQFIQYSGDMLGDSILAFGDNYLNTPYKFGAAFPYSASNKFFDCSSFTKWVAQDMGVTLPRASYDQAEKYAKIGRDQLQKGDLMFFTVSSRDTSNGVGHVGIYAGNNTILHTYSNQTVGVMFMTLTTSWWNRFKWGGRMITPAGDGFIK